MSEYFTFDMEFNKPRTATKIEVKKFNKNNQLCYYDAVDLTCKGISDEQLDIFVKLFSSAGFEVEIHKHTYFGIYDPSRFVEIIEIYPTDEELLEKETIATRFFTEKERKKVLGLFNISLV